MGKEDSPVEEQKQLHAYLPHTKYIKKMSKLHLQRKQEAIKFIQLDKNQIAKAVKCLQDFARLHANPTDLFSSEGFIYVEIDLDVIPESHTIRPIQIPLPVPIYSAEFHSRFSIFSSDPSEAFTDKLEGLEVPLISEVIGYEKAKKNYKLNTDKLKLLAANDLFFCDWKIYNLLRKPLGKLFYAKKKFPYPIDCEEVPENLRETYSTYGEYLNSLSQSTYCMLGNGPVYTIKIARISMSVPDVVKNVMRGVYRALPHILGKDVGVEKVRQISLKSYNSCSLPVYNHVSKEETKAFRKYVPPAAIE